MKKVLTTFGYVLLSVLLLIYLCFLFVLPNVLDLNNYKNDFQKLVKDQSGLNIDFKDAKIITTPLLGLGFKANDIKITLPDGSTFVSTNSIKTRVALPSLLALTVKISTLEIENPVINLDIINKKDYKILLLVEEILNKHEEVLQTGIVQKQKTNILSYIKIKVPNINISNYKVSINDLSTKDNLKLFGENLKIGYLNGKILKVKTNANLSVNDSDKILACVDINTFLPPQVKLDEEDDKSQRIHIPLPNLISLYKSYNPEGVIDAKLRLRTYNGIVSVRGYLNILDFKYRMSNISLPKSYFTAKFHGHKVKYDTNIYLSRSKSVSSSGSFKYGKNPYADIKVYADKIQFADILFLAKSFLNASDIKNDLDIISASGDFSADFRIKTNLKKNKSEGKLTFDRGKFINKKTGYKIAQIDSKVIFDDNIIDIANTIVKINETYLNLSGTIDNNSNADIVFDLQNLPLKNFYKAIATPSLLRAYAINSGAFSIKGKIQDKLKKPSYELKTNLSNLVIFDKISKIYISNDDLNAGMIHAKNKFDGKIINNNFKLSFPQTKSTLSIPAFAVDFNRKDLVIKPCNIYFNDKTKIEFDGIIKNYLNNPKYDADAFGNIETSDLVKFLGNEAVPFVEYKGRLPLEFAFDGNKFKQTLKLRISTDKNNYMTPFHFTSIQNKEGLFRFVADFKGNRIKIKDTGFWTIEEKIINAKKKKYEIVENDIVKISGTILKNHINLIQISLPKELQGTLVAFRDSYFELFGKLLIFGDIQAPRMRGFLNAENISLPSLFTKLSSAGLKFRGDNLDINVNNLNLNGSDMNIKISSPIDYRPIFTISDINISSNLLNVDKMIKISDILTKLMPSSTSSKALSDIPVIIRGGNLNIRKLISGNIVLNGINSAVSMKRNVFYLNNFRTYAFNGRIWGDISHNLLTTLTGVKARGVNLSAEKLLLDCAGMKDTVAGTLGFNTDISLKGLTYDEQVKSLKGDVEFNIKNGQFGPFGRFENMILAENIRESEFFKTAIGEIINSIASVDTSHFDELQGMISFSNGIVQIMSIGTKGDTVCLNISGEVNVPANSTDMKVRGRLASKISDMLGPIAAINPVNLIKNTPGLNLASAKAFAIFCEEITEDELKAIPDFTSNAKDYNATKFQIVLKGDMAKPLTLVKSFKWLAVQSEISLAETFVNALPDSEPENPKKKNKKNKTDSKL